MSVATSKKPRRVSMASDRQELAGVAFATDLGWMALAYCGDVIVQLVVGYGSRKAATDALQGQLGDAGNMLLVDELVPAVSDRKSGVDVLAPQEVGKLEVIGGAVRGRLVHDVVDVDIKQPHQLLKFARLRLAESQRLADLPNCLALIRQRPDFFQIATRRNRRRLRHFPQPMKSLMVDGRLDLPPEFLRDFFQLRNKAFGGRGLRLVPEQDCPDTL